MRSREWKGTKGHCQAMIHGMCTEYRVGSHMYFRPGLSPVVVGVIDRQGEKT